MPSNAFIFPNYVARYECSAAPQVKSWKPPVVVTMEEGEEEQEKTRLSILLSIELKRLLPPSEAQLACACVVLSMCEYVWLLAPRVSGVTPAVLLMSSLSPGELLSKAYPKLHAKKVREND